MADTFVRNDRWPAVKEKPRTFKFGYKDYKDKNCKEQNWTESIFPSRCLVRISKSMKHPVRIKNQLKLLKNLI